MTPRERHFLVGFVLGERAVEAARESRLPESILAEIDGATKYAEGRGVRIGTGQTRCPGVPRPPCVERVRLHEALQLEELQQLLVEPKAGVDIARRKVDVRDGVKLHERVLTANRGVRAGGRAARPHSQKPSGCRTALGEARCPVRTLFGCGRRPRHAITDNILA